MQAHVFESNIAEEDGSVLLNEPKENRTIRVLLLHKIREFESEFVEHIGGTNDVTRQDEHSVATVGAADSRDKKEKGKNAFSTCEKQIRGFLEAQCVEEVESHK